MVIPGDGRLTIKWLPSDEEDRSTMTAYKVQWKQDAHGWDTPADVFEGTVTDLASLVTSGGEHAVQVPALTNGVVYTVRVIAVASTGNNQLGEIGGIIPGIPGVAGILQGLCDRTGQVRDAIMAKLLHLNDCSLVTDLHLENMTGSIDLRASGVDALLAQDFRGLTNLEQLDLAANDLSALPEGVFDGLTNLEQLDLAANDLSALPKGVFDGLTNLEQLDLAANDLSALPEGVFDGLTNLERLDLASNDLSVLPEGVFDGLTNLAQLDLASNDLSVLPEGVFDGLTNLAQLYLYENALSALPEGVFDGLTNLEKLFLHGNDLSALPEGVFDGLTNLEKLFLHGNDLSALPEGVFDGLTNLEKLFLHENALSKLPERVFNKLSNLNVLYLWGNDLSKLPDDLFDDLSTLRQLKLHDNPGAPFAFTTELAQVDDAVAVELAQAVPFDMVVTLLTQGGTLSTSIVTVDAGTSRSEVIPVTRDDEGPVTLTMVSAAFQSSALPGGLTFNFEGMQADLGQPLTLRDGEDGNTPATGRPAITGIPQVGETLTASTTGIEDADGLTGVTFTYQWLADGVDIAGATSARYTPADTAEGKTISVRVSFTDDRNFEETLTSAPTDAVVVAETVPGTPRHLKVFPHDAGALDVSWEAPATDGGSAITEYRVQWKETAGNWDTPADVSEETVTSTTHTITGLTDGVEYTVRVIATNDVGDGAPSDEATGTPRETTPPELSTATVDGATLTLTYDEDLDENSEPSSDAFSVTVGGTGRVVDGVSVTSSSVILTLGWAVASGATVTVSYAAPADAAAARIRDLAGNATASFTGQAVTNNTPRPNSPATGAPTISGTAQVGETLTVETSAIDDADGLDNVGYSYQWLADGVEIAGATDPTYTLVAADEGKTIKVQVSFTDDRSHQESLTSTPTAAVAPRPNIPATGLPTITGTPQVGETLTADISGIDDADGLTGAAFTYQWMSNDGNGDADIAGATGVSYTLADTDEGKTIKVRVSFTDDRNFQETLTSAPTSSVVAAAPSAGICARTQQVRDAILGRLPGISDCALVTEAGLNGITGSIDLRNSGIDALAAGDFAGLSGLEKLLLQSNNLEGLPDEVFDDLTGLAHLNMARNSLSELPDGVFGSLTGLEILYMGRNEFEELPSDVFAGLSDLTYLQLSHNDLTELPDGVFEGLSSLENLRLTGNPGASFVLMAELERREDDAVVVRVVQGAPFTMNISLSVEGGDLSDESIAIPAGSIAGGVVAVTPGGSGLVTVSVESASFQGGNHNGIEADTGGPLVLPGAEAANTPATGLPTISGTAQVGDTLTVYTSGISDANGLTGASFGYQWISSDGNADTEIQGATDPTYTLVAADEGKIIKVRVSFTDDANNQETLTSDATAAVAAETAAPDAPQSLNVSPDDSGTLDVSWEAPASDGGSAITGYKVQWKSGSEDYDGSAGSTRQAEITNPASRTHTITGLTDDVEYTVRVIAVNDAGDGPPSDEATATPLSREARLRQFVETGVVQEYEADHPWLRKVWAYMSEPGFDLVVLDAPAHRGEVAISCGESSVSGLEDCEAQELRMGVDYLEDEGVIIHEMANIYTLANDIASDPAPLGIAHLYFDSLDSDCRAHDLYADVMTIGVLGHVQLAHWGECNRTNANGIDDTLTQQALALVESVLDGEMPKWFADTYNDTDGTADLERVWADLKAVEVDEEDELDTRIPVVYQLRDAFGGYCNSEKAGESVFDDGVTRNPWQDGGCVPEEPGNLTTTAGDTVLDLSWEKPGYDGGSPIEGYRVQWKSGSEEYDDTPTSTRQAEVADLANLAHTITGLTNGVEYTVRVLAYNHNGVGSASTEVSATPEAPNSPATGQPTISGTAQVGETLTANTTGIADADGLTNVSFSYQWLADDTETAGATGGSYTLADVDEGKTIKVRVSFTDDRSHQETLTSAATAPVTPAAVESSIWASTLTVERWGTSDNRLFGFDALVERGELDPPGFSHYGVEYRVEFLFFQKQTRQLHFATYSNLAAGSYLLNLDGTPFQFEASGTENKFSFSKPGLKWRNGDEVEVSLTLAD